MRVRPRPSVLVSVALLVSLLASSTGWAAPAPVASVGDDSFFVPPSPLPAGAPGDIIRWRPSTSYPFRTPPHAWQVMYLSTNAVGERIAVTGTVLMPRNVDPAAAPVIGFAAGTQGPAFRCRPSAMIAMGAFYEQPAINDMLTAGYAVAVTDYEGYHPTPKTTYVTGRSEGHAVIDAVRAAQRLTAAGLSNSAKVMFRGYSQGGGAAMWAGQLQPSYAPELNLVGVVGGGVPADLVQVALGLEGKPGFGFLFYSLIGLDNAYSELDLASYLNSAGQTARAAMEADGCTLELLLQLANKRLSDFTTTSPVLTPAWLSRVMENKLGGSAINVPVFQYHATSDDIVAFGQAQALRDEYCRLGMSVTWRTYATDHITLVYTGNADALAFMKARLAGEPPSPNC